MAYPSNEVRLIQIRMKIKEARKREHKTEA
jgi:hypothetical protein